MFTRGKLYRAITEGELVEIEDFPAIPLYQEATRAAKHKQKEMRKLLHYKPDLRVVLTAMILTGTFDDDTLASFAADYSEARHLALAESEAFFDRGRIRD